MAIQDLKQAFHTGIAAALSEVGEDIAASMRERLQEAGHIDTGALYESIRSETIETQDEVTTYVYADAKSPDGTQYAEFIELGSGAAHGRPGGRVGTWRYQDRAGKWHTTDGMDADPFIEPAVEEHIGRIQDRLKEVLFDIAKYGKEREIIDD